MEMLARDSLRIVHVEDDHEFASLSQTFLKRAGFEQPIVRCEDGLLAVDYFSRLEPDEAPHVILLDLHMPRMNGLEVLLWLRRNQSEPSVAIYLLTSSDDPSDLRQAEVNGVTAYLFKRPSFHELIEKLDAVIESTNQKRLREMSEMQNIMGQLAIMGTFSTEMIILTDVRGRIFWMNEQFVRASGLTLEGTLGKRPDRILQVEDPDRVKVEMLHDAVRTKGACDCQVTHHHNGNSCPIHISLGPVFSDDRLEGFIAVGRDLREEEEALAIATEDWRFVPGGVITP